MDRTSAQPQANLRNSVKSQALKEERSGGGLEGNIQRDPRFFCCLLILLYPALPSANIGRLYHTLILLQKKLIYK